MTYPNAGSTSQFRALWVQPYSLVIGRSLRYLNDRINYDFLNEVEGRKGFIGPEKRIRIYQHIPESRH